MELSSQPSPPRELALWNIYQHINLWIIKLTLLPNTIQNNPFRYVEDTVNFLLGSSCHC